MGIVEFGENGTRHLCNYNRELTCLHTHQIKCCDCVRTDVLPWAIIEYNPTWCPDGQVISQWISKERAEKIYELNNLDDHETSTFEIRRIK